MRVKFSALTDAERNWIAQQLEVARLMVAAMSPADGDGPVTLEALDRAFAAWLASAVEDTTQVNGTINCVGVQFGQFLVDQVGFDWTIATDNNGTDLAVLALPGRGDVLVYPANFVAKRWERRECNFLVNSFQTIREQVASVSANWASASRRTWWQFWR